MNLRLLRLVLSFLLVMLASVLVALVVFDREPVAIPVGVPVPVASMSALGKFVPATTRGEPLELRFQDAVGAARNLAAFHGRVVLINLWATWCAPCITEMPALDRLQAKLGGADFEIVAIALDRQGEPLVRPFFDKLALTRLALYLDPSNAVSRDLEARALPISVLVDRDGREIGRVVGPAEWDAPEFAQIVRAAMAR